jgi:iron complex transport system substrate-binding protein
MLRRPLAAIAASVSLVLAPSAVAAAPSAAGSSRAFPVTVKSDSGPVRIATPPRRIVSLSPTATEMLFAVGAGAQVIAVDDQSTYPAAAPKTRLSGFKPNVEAIAKYRPDLVVVSNDIDGIVKKLGKLKIPVLLDGAPAGLAGAYRQIGQIGIATGHRAQAGRVVGRMKARIATAVASVGSRRGTVRFFHELGPELYSATSHTFIGSVYARLGLVNIADDAVPGNDYPQLSSEAVVAANPQIVFLADTKCCGQDAASVAARPGWSGMSAVRSGAVVELDDDVASRWGPRIVEFVETVARRVKVLAPAA